MDDRIRRIKKRRKKKGKPVDVALIVISLIGSTVGCLLLGSLISWLRWLILVSGGITLTAGVVLAIYVLYQHDEDLFSDIDVSPRSCAAGLVIILGIVQLIVYVMLGVRGGW